jgi:hypothetical protein
MNRRLRRDSLQLEIDEHVVGSRSHARRMIGRARREDPDPRDPLQEDDDGDECDDSARWDGVTSGHRYAVRSVRGDLSKDREPRLRRPP